MLVALRRRLPSILSVLLAISIPTARSQAQDVPPSSEYATAARQLEEYIAEQVKDKRLPALSIALVDDQKIVWARGFRFANAKEKKPATAGTVYRVGSVSKLFTDIAIMQLAEKGDLDLDAPVTKYLADFKPENPFGKSVTLRQLMTHRSGLVRESPVGNYFDPTGPTLAATVASLNRTKLVLEPETKAKYSNAGIAAVGLVLERTKKKPFVDYLTDSLLKPLGMEQSSFAPTEAIRKELAEAVMWSYHGREFPAPTFELGMAPAGSMYSTVLDLGKFLSVLFNGGEGPGERMLKKETLEKMWTPQFARKEDKEGFGIGFFVREYQGHRRIGHGGAVYGFATDLSALPDDKLGVVVIASRDVANSTTSHIAETALDFMLAVKQKKPLPKLERPEKIDRAAAMKLVGQYRCGEKTLDISESAGRVWVLPSRSGLRADLKRQGDHYVTDGLLSHGVKIVPDVDRLKINKDVYERVPSQTPAASPEKWQGLIGEYGWDHNVLYILEKDGKLHCLIEWVFHYPLEEESSDVFKFPNFGLYHDEKLVFTRDKKGRATKVEAANVVFERRPIDGDDGRTFRIEPRRPVAELVKAAKTATPPRERGEFNKPDLVELTSLEPSIKLDIRYAAANNFLGAPLYAAAKAYMQRPAAEALVRVHRKLKDQGYGLLIHDGYRPWPVTKVFWDATPDRFRLFVADPEQGSRHNRGCAVDLTLFDVKTGKAVEMPGGYDEFSDRSYPDYVGGTSLQRYHRDLLRRHMEAEGFTVFEAEWWHYDYRDWKKYPVSSPGYAAANRELLGPPTKRDGPQ